MFIMKRMMLILTTAFCTFSVLTDNFYSTVNEAYSNYYNSEVDVLDTTLTYIIGQKNNNYYLSFNVVANSSNKYTLKIEKNNKTYYYDFDWNGKEVYHLPLEEKDIISFTLTSTTHQVIESYTDNIKIESNWYNSVALTEGLNKTNIKEAKWNKPNILNIILGILIGLIYLCGISWFVYKMKKLKLKKKDHVMTIDELDKLSKEDLRGKVICFPTDTVYGVGCLIDDEEGTKKIYSIKKRDLDKPLAVLVSSSGDVPMFTDDIPSFAIDWMNTYWPGALTIIYKKKENLDLPCCKNSKGIGLRMPNSNISLAVLNKFGPLATTSINISGKPPLNDLNQIMDLFGDQIDYYITDKPGKFSKVSSTVVDLSTDVYRILREGDVKLF